MKQTKNSVLSLYLQHIKDLVVMLGNTSDWEFVIGDIDIIDDGNKKRLYFINEKSKKLKSQTPNKIILTIQSTDLTT